MNVAEIEDVRTGQTEARARPDEGRRRHLGARRHAVRDHGDAVGRDAERVDDLAPAEVADRQKETGPARVARHEHAQPRAGPWRIQVRTPYERHVVDDERERHRRQERRVIRRDEEIEPRSFTCQSQRKTQDVPRHRGRAWNVPTRERAMFGDLRIRGAEEGETVARPRDQRERGHEVAQERLVPTSPGPERACLDADVHLKHAAQRAMASPSSR